MSRKLTDILEKCRIMVQNAATDTDIKKALAGFGYTQERLDQGLELYNSTATLFDEQNKENLEMREAINKHIEAKIACEDEFSKVSKLAKVALRNNPLARNIVPDYPMPDAFNNWKKAASNFYNNILANPMALESYTQFGYHSEKLQSLIANINACDNLMNSRIVESAEAQAATQKRDVSFTQLKTYCSDMTVVAKIALEDNKQLLEKLGIVVPN